MALERIYFVGTGYSARDAANTQTIAVNIGDVAVVACGFMPDREACVCLYSSTKHLLAALPWPEDVHDDAAAVRWWLDAAAALAAAAPW